MHKGALIEPYNTKLETKRDYWLGVSVVRDNSRLSKEGSRKHLITLIKKIRTATRDYNRVIFYAPNPRRARAYLIVLHCALDTCEVNHKVDELLECIKEHGIIKVVTRIDEL